MGELLNNFFASVFTIENTEQFPPVRQYFLGHENEKLNYFSISSKMVEKKLDKLKMNNRPLVLMQLEQEC